MANEKEIRVLYPVTGQNDVTAAIYKPDNTIRDTQTAIALTDSGHPGLYSNDAVSITIEAGDLIYPAVGGVRYGAGIEYRPAVTIINIAEVVTAILAANGFTVGGTLTVSDLYKYLAGWIVGNLKDKSGEVGVEVGVYQTTDADDVNTVIFETTLRTEGTPRKEVTII